MDNHQRTLLGQLLVSYGMVTEADLSEALARQEGTEEPLGQLLLSMGALTSRDLETALRAQARLRGRPDVFRPHVLVVDDEPEVGAVLGEILSGAGYSVGIAQDAVEATVALSEGEGAAVALVVLDLGLPGVSGVKLLSQLRAAGCRTPVIVLTGQPDMETQVRAAGLEISQFMIKPVSARTLLDVVEATLHGSVPART